MTPLLAIRQLRKEFPIVSPILRRRLGSLVAVDGVDLEIAAGETVALVGESGSGKTTIGRALVRLIEPTSGEIDFRGQNLLALSAGELRRQRRWIQMVFQDPYSSLNPRLRVGAAVVEPLEVHRLIARSERAGRARELLEEVGLQAADAERFPHQFSGGQRQRIGIARALATSPELVIADEPVSALDVSVRAQIVNLLLDLRQSRGLALLFIAHDLALVARIADRIAVLYLGRVVELASSVALARRALHPYTVALLSAVPNAAPGPPKGRIALTGDPPSPAAIPSGCRFRTRCPVGRQICQEVDPPLTEVEPGHAVACHFPGALRSDPPE